MGINTSSSSSRPRFHRLLYHWILVLQLLICLCSNNRFVVAKTSSTSSTRSNLFSLKLRNTPIGIGIQSALSERFSREQQQQQLDDAFHQTKRCRKYRRQSLVLLAGGDTKIGDVQTTTTCHISHPLSQQQQHQEQQQEEEEVYLEGAESYSYVDSLVTNAGNVKPTKRKSFSFFRRNSSNDDLVVLCKDDQVGSTLVNTEDAKRTLHQQPPGNASRGGGGVASKTAAAAAAAVAPHRPLVFWESMISGAISRSVAQTIMHPANTMKTILQSSRKSTNADIVSPTVLSILKSPNSFQTLRRGAGANFILSVPHGAINFAMLEFVRHRLNAFIQSVPSLQKRSEKMGPGLDFLSSAISTICCSVVSTPQMMITDNIMAGNYPNLLSAAQGLYTQQGIIGFYRGWWPGLVGKIPSYALTWTLFQQLKVLRDRLSDRPAKNIENTMMGCIASGATVCFMMPLDTIKTRLVTQLSSKAIQTSGAVPYKGIIDCAVRMTQEEGIKAFYKGLAPRLISVVPMIGIQFGVYEAMKRVMLHRDVKRLTAQGQQKGRDNNIEEEEDEAEQALEVSMEVAASLQQPYPVPHFEHRIAKTKKSIRNLMSNTPFFFGWFCSSSWFLTQKFVAIWQEQSSDPATGED